MLCMVVCVRACMYVYVYVSARCMKMQPTSSKTKNAASLKETKKMQPTSSEPKNAANLK